MLIIHGKFIIDYIPFVIGGTYASMRNGVVRAASYSVEGAASNTTPKHFIRGIAAEHARYPRRQNQAEMIIRSFRPVELDKKTIRLTFSYLSWQVRNWQSASRPIGVFS